MIKKFIPFVLFLAVVFIGCSEDDALPLINEVPEAQACDATHSLIGESRQLRVSNAYGISGTVTVISDCEIEFSNFNYNGTGPAVSIYGGLNGNFIEGRTLSEPIHGRAFDNETFSVFLPEGVTLDQFNSFSVWCFQFNIDFSSASFQ